MADPLSVGSGLVTLISACTAIGKHTVSFIGALRDAPLELVLLSNEVNDLNAILNEVSYAFSTKAYEQSIPSSTQQNMLAQSMAIQTQIRHAKGHIIELDTLIGSLRKYSPKNGSVDIDRLGWVKKRKTTLRLQQKLAKVKGKLHLLLKTSTVARMSRIESIVRHETVDAMQHRQQSDEKLDLILTKLTNLSSYPQVMTAERYPVVQPRTLAAVEPDLARSRIQDLSSQAYSNSLAIQEDTAIAALQCQQRRTDFCEDICNCVCHLRNRSWWRSPLILKNVVGFFFLGYSGLKFLKPACTSRGCRSYSSQVCRVTYYAPRWLLAKAVCIATGKTPYGDLFFILRVQSRTDYLAPNSLYRLAHRNDTRGIQEAFERRVANPNDADQYTGSTSLHIAVRACSLEAISLLLARGASPDLEDDFGLTAIQAAWEKIYLHDRRSSLPGNIQGLTRAFPEYQSIDSFDFSYIHKVVLKVYPLSLEQVLLQETWRAQINCLDSWGRTPLHWAVRRGDLAAVHALLSAGADVDVQDHARKTPLHFAAETLDRKCLQLLLQAKANPNIIDASGANPALCAVVSSFVVLPLVLADTFPSKDSICRETHQYLISTIADNLFVDHLRKTCERVITFSPCWRYHPELIGILCERGRNIDKHGSSIIFWATRGVYCPRVDALDVTMEQQRRILDTINPRSKFRSLLEQLISTIEVLRQDSKPEDEPGEPSYTQRRGQVTGFSDSLQVVVACLGVALIAITLAFGIFPV